MSVSNKRFAGGIAGMLVASAATLSILIVCFSIYQYFQPTPVSDPDPNDEHRRAVLDPPSVTGDGKVSVISTRIGEIGPAKRIRQTIYGQKGKQAIAELTADSLVPVEREGDNARVVEVVKPEIRLRTDAGNLVRVTADMGIIELKKDAPVRLDLQSGRLMGNVVIEIDRLTDAARAALPEETRDTPEASSIVRVECAEIEFDREFGTIRIPGPFHLTAVDVDWRGPNLELQYDEILNRIEYLRSVGESTLELRGGAGGLGLALPASAAGASRHATIVEALMGSLRRKLPLFGKRRSKTGGPPNTAPGTSQTDVPEWVDARGRPVGASQPEEDVSGTPPMYVGRFEGDVDTVHRIDTEIMSRLQCDILEIVRDFTSFAPTTAGGDRQSASTGNQATAPTVDERIVLTWSGRLAVSALPPDDERSLIAGKSRVTAIGDPLRVAHPDGVATAATLTFEPNDDRFQLEGSASRDVEVRWANLGWLTGRSVRSTGDGDQWHLRILGPGKLKRNAAATDEETISMMPAGAIEFAQTLDVFGRIVTERTLALSQFSDPKQSSKPVVGSLEALVRAAAGARIATRKRRVIDRATFVGDVRMRQNQMGIDADTLTLFFTDAASAVSTEPRVDRVEAEGHVVIRRGDERLTCRELLGRFTVDAAGRLVPTSLTALGDVGTEQGERTVNATEKLILEFTTVSRPPPPFDMIAARQRAVDAGKDPSKVDWNAYRLAYESKPHIETLLTRFRAFGDVRVIDPADNVEILAERLDCSLGEGQRIEKAEVTGLDSEHLASVRLDTLSVMGERILLDVAKDWARVPGAGLMTFRSQKDLDGRRLSEPVPIRVLWRDGMEYRGGENRAIFSGKVHATSKSNTRIDCEQLVVEFDDVAVDTGPPAEPGQDWWIFEDLFEGLADPDRKTREKRFGTNFAKEPATIHASGGPAGEAVVHVENRDAAGRIETRMRVSGPIFTVNLRKAVSIMLIEGAGTLLLEDLRAPEETDPIAQAGNAGFLTAGTPSRPSTTLITWQQSMTYDFAIDRTWFRGDVELKHKAGAALERIGLVAAGTGGTSERSTFLSCGELTVAFKSGERGEIGGRGANNRMGRLSADRLDFFEASGNVKLQDSGQGFWMSADLLNYMKDRNTLSVYGTTKRHAVINMQRKGQPPTSFSAARFIYNTKSGQIEEWLEPSVTGR